MIVGGTRDPSVFRGDATCFAFMAICITEAPDELTAAVVLLTAPDGNKGCAIVVAYIGAVEDGERSSGRSRLREAGRWTSSARSRTSGQQSLLEQAMPPNLNYQKADFLTDVSDGLIEMRG